MKHTKTLIAAAVTALIAGTAVAGEGDKDKSKHGASFSSLDTNRDGRISKAEAAADSTLVFTSADANGDGYLDSAEYKAVQKGDKTMSPQSTEPASDTAGSSSSPAMPEDRQPGSNPQPDTETPRQ